jgi:hypothetical protein
MIDEIRDKISAGRFEYSRPRLTKASCVESVQEVREAIATAEVIENYPDDKYGPSCLILGITLAGRHLHIQCSHPSRPLIKIITLYEPDPDLWVDFRVRKV